MNTSIRIVFKYFFKSPVFMNTFWIHFEYISYITEISKKNLKQLNKTNQWPRLIHKPETRQQATVLLLGRLGLH